MLAGITHTPQALPGPPGSSLTANPAVYLHGQAFKHLGGDQGGHCAGQRAPRDLSNQRLEANAGNLALLFFLADDDLVGWGG